MATKKKQKINKQENNKTHNICFNLLEENWIPVITFKNEKKLLSLIDFLKKAHELKRFDFPLPGLETAIIRFLVAIVYIVGAPKSKKDWINWYNKKKFSNKFIKDLENKYKDKFDLFSPKEPFLQDINSNQDNSSKENSIYRLIHFFPSGTNQTHWMHKFEKNNNSLSDAISPQAATWLILFFCCTAYSGGRSYKPGINGPPPNYALLLGDNLYYTIILNTLNKEFINELGKQYQNFSTAKEGFPKNLDGNGKLHPKDINLQTGLLWLPRRILLIPKENTENKICCISNIVSDTIIENLYFNNLDISLDDSLYWHDPFVFKIENNNQKKRYSNYRVAGSLPVWKDYPLLVYQNFGKNKINIYQPLVIQHINYINLKKLNLFKIILFSFSTDGKAKFNQINEVKFYFSRDLIINQNNGLANKIFSIVNLVEKFAGVLLNSLEKAFKKENKNKKIPEFQTAYWYELGSEFEYSLARFLQSEAENYADQILKDWKKMLANHVIKTFDRHTVKLIYNTKNLKNYVLAKSELLAKINKELLQ